MNDETEKLPDLSSIDLKESDEFLIERPDVGQVKFPSPVMVELRHDVAGALHRAFRRMSARQPEIEWTKQTVQKLQEVGERAVQGVAGAKLARFFEVSIELQPPDDVGFNVQIHRDASCYVIRDGKRVAEKRIDAAETASRDGDD